MNTLISQIISMNHAWKLAAERWSDKSNLASALKNRKSSLQARLLREHPNMCFLTIDNENTEGEALYSLKFKVPITLGDGRQRRDAEHMPVRLAEELFTENELKKIIK